MEISQWIEIGVAVSMLLGVAGAFFRLQSSNKTAWNEINRLEKLLEGADGTGGIRATIAELQTAAKQAEHIEKEVKGLIKEQQKMNQILTRIAAKLDIDIPYQ